MPVTDITEAGTHQARQKLAEAEQKRQRSALIEALAAAKAMIDEAQDTDTVALLTKLLTQEEVQNVRTLAITPSGCLLIWMRPANSSYNLRYTFVF